MHYETNGLDQNKETEHFLHVTVNDNLSWPHEHKNYTYNIPSGTLRVFVFFLLW